MSYAQNTNCSSEAEHDIVSIWILVLKRRTHTVFLKYYETSTLIGYITPIYSVYILPKVVEIYRKNRREERVLLELGEEYSTFTALSLSVSLFLFRMNFPRTNKL